MVGRLPTYTTFPRNPPTKPSVAKACWHSAESGESSSTITAVTNSWSMLLAILESLGRSDLVSLIENLPGKEQFARAGFIDPPNFRKRIVTMGEFTIKLNGHHFTIVETS